jgi:hypothetical protein
MAKHSELRELDRKSDKLHRLKYTPAFTPEIEDAYEAAAKACRDYREAHDLVGKRGY